MPRILTVGWGRLWRDGDGSAVWAVRDSFVACGVYGVSGVCAAPGMLCASCMDCIHSMLV